MADKPESGNTFQAGHGFSEKLIDERTGG